MTTTTTSYIDYREVPGLTYIEDFITEEEEKHLIDAIDNSGDWTTQISRRTIQYGYLYDYHRAAIVTRVDPIPDHFQFLVDRLQPHYSPNVINQAIVNEYAGKMQGIKKHIDYEEFGPVIASVSLNDPCVMVFHEVNEEKELTGKLSQIVLKPRSVIIMRDTARYFWKHEVPSMKEYKKRDLQSTIDSPSAYRRISVTLRTVGNGAKLQHLSDATQEA